MPVRAKDDGLYWLNYQTGKEVLLNNKRLSQLPSQWLSEVMLTDWSHEGRASGFDFCVVDLFGRMTIGATDRPQFDVCENKRLGNSIFVDI
jgi:hypothetical protein